MCGAFRRLRWRSVLDTEYGGKFYGKYALWYRDPAQAARLKAYRELYDSEELKLLGQLRAEGRKSFWKNTLEVPKRREHVPEELVLEKGTELPDYIHDTCIGRLVSQKLKDIIETVEPAGNGFSFFEVAIYGKDGARLPSPYFQWDVYRKIDAIDGSRDGVKTVMGAPTGTHRWTYAGGGIKRCRDYLAVLAERTAGMAAWTDFRFGESRVFISDALHEAMRAAGVSGYEAQSEWAEV